MRNSVRQYVSVSAFTRVSLEKQGKDKTGWVYRENDGTIN